MNDAREPPKAVRLECRCLLELGVCEGFESNLLASAFPSSLQRIPWRVENRRCLSYLGSWLVLSRLSYDIKDNKSNINNDHTNIKNDIDAIVIISLFVC